MAFDPVTVVEARLAQKYDGTNSADLNNAIADFTVVGEDATSGLTFTSGGQQYTVARNGYITWYQGRVDHVYQNGQDYQGAFRAAALAAFDHVHDLVLTTGPAKPEGAETP